LYGDDLDCDLGLSVEDRGEITVTTERIGCRKHRGVQAGTEETLHTKRKTKNTPGGGVEGYGIWIGGQLNHRRPGGRKWTSPIDLRARGWSLGGEKEETKIDHSRSSGVNRSQSREGSSGKCARHLSLKKLPFWIECSQGGGQV